MTVTPVLFIHIAAGGLAIVSGAAAVSVRKGEPLHRAFGTVFFLSMLVMSAMGAYLALLLTPEQTVFLPQKASVVVGIFTFYLVATAWTAVKRNDGGIGSFERIAFIVAVSAATALVFFGMQAAASPTGRLQGGPAANYYVFASFATFAAALDLKVILRGGISGAAHIARHLWRMCFALFFASAFFFLGQQKVMPAFMHGSRLLLVPALAPLVLLIFWMIRVRLTKWYKAQAEGT
jgi:uncharacterized membrane protein